MSLGAELAKSGRKVGIRAVAAREKDGFVAEAVRQFVRRAQRPDAFSRHSQPGTRGGRLSDFVAGPTTAICGGMPGLPDLAECSCFGARGNGVDRVRAGENDPIERSRIGRARHRGDA